MQDLVEILKESLYDAMLMSMVFVFWLEWGDEPTERSKMVFKCPQ